MSDARDPARAGHRTVLVAGGTGALGGAVLRALLDADYPVVASWLLETERDRVYDEFPTADQLTLVHADLTDASSVGSAVADVRDLGAVVNLVGGYVDGTKVHETDPEAFDAMLRINLRPGFLLARAAMPQLIAAGGGAFVGVSARAALAPFPGAAGYITAKAAVLAFIQALDTEYRDAGIRCNAVLPSVVDTAANRRAQPDADFSRWVAPERIAAVIRFLVSADSAPISGAAIPVYGRA